jgi:hypothetical protein
LHKDEKFIPSSNVKKLGKRIIEESLDQGKAYPINS